MKVFQALGRGQGGTRKPLSPRSPSDGDGAELACTDSAPQELTNCSQEGCRGGTAGGIGAQSVARPISREGAWHHGLLPETHLCPPWLAWASALPATTLHMLPSVIKAGVGCVQPWAPGLPLCQGHRAGCWTWEDREDFGKGARNSVQASHFKYGRIPPDQVPPQAAS